MRVALSLPTSFALWLLTCACATTAAPPTDSGTIEVVVLRPTVKGRAVDAAAVDDAVLATALASVRWWSYFEGSGSVHFLPDQTVCTRSPRSVWGIAIPAHRYGSTEEFSLELMKLDVAAAETAALEADVALEDAEAWLLVDEARVNEATSAARALMAAAQFRVVRVGVTAHAEKTSSVRLLLLPQGRIDVVTDTLPLRTVGPGLTSVADRLHVLAAGPASGNAQVMDGLSVVVDVDGAVVTWQAPGPRAAPADAAWLAALAEVMSAGDRGCALSQ
jgi:hypothetical protein